MTDPQPLPQRWPEHLPAPHRRRPSMGAQNRKASRQGNQPRGSQPDSAREILTALAPPVYIPTAIFSIGSGGIQPVLVLAATDVGMSHAAAAGVLGLLGVVGVISAPLAGAVVARIGGKRSMVVGTVLALAAVGAILAVLSLVRGSGTHMGAGPSIFIAAIVAQGVAGNLWGLARQGYIADAVPSWARARALSFLGGMMRLGVLIGPAIGAGAILLAGRRGPFILQALACLAAMVMVVRCALPAQALEAAHRSPSAATINPAALPPQRTKVDLRATAVVALAMTCLQLLRTNRNVIVPLWGAHLGMSDALISATFAAGALLDVAMFLPSGRWMDRYGRLAGIVPALGIMGASIIVTIVWTTPLGFIIGTCLMGFGNGFGSGIVMTMGADLAPQVGREKFLGWWQGIGNVGSAAGPFVVSALTATVGLTAGMWVTAGLGVGGAVWAALAMRRAYRHAGMDLRGRALTSRGA